MNVRHGTTRGYTCDGCHCAACRAAVAKEANVYKMRRTANGGRPLMLPKLGSVRRLQALMALGWPRRELAKQAGYTGDAFSPILNGDRASVTTASAARVREVYDRLSMTCGPSEVTRRHGRRMGWPPPLAWDDPDDPDETPTGWHYISTDRATALLELDSFGLGVSEVCRRLDMTRHHLQKWCGRHGMSDVYRRLAAREDGMANEQLRGGLAS